MKARLLSYDEIFGKNKLDIIREKGIQAKTTDFAKATGVWVSSEGNVVYYLKTPHNGFVYVGYMGISDYRCTDGRNIGVRPVLEFSSIDEIFKYGGEILEGNKLRFGTYSNNAILKIDQEKWTNKLNSGMLEGCGSYTLDGTKYNDCDVNYNPIKVPIYEYNDKRVTMIKINSSFGGMPFLMSNGELYKDGNYVWHEVNDVMWDFDKERLIAVCEDVILGGIQFCNEKNNYHSEEEFSKTNMSKYLNDVFLPELLQFQNITLDNKEEDSNLDEVKNLLCKLENNRRYIKYLEEENEKYKKFLDEVNANLENIVHQINKSNIYKPQN